MSTVKVTNLQNASSASPNIVLDSSGNATMAGSMAMATPFAMRNKIINGAMEIDQRNSGASVTPTANAYTLDRWLANVSIASKYSVQQSSVAPAGFVNSALITSTSAYTVASGDYEAFQQRIEAYNMSDAAWGTSSAKSFTLSFWVRSSLTGTFGGSLYFPASTARTYPFSYVINAANTWEYKTITVPGDTVSNTATTTNNIYVLVQWSLGMGSTYTTSTSGWQNGNFGAPTGCTNLVATNGATLYLTGIQFEVGTVATPFERRLINQELAMCQRYYQTAPTSCICYDSTGLNWQLGLPVSMRATPTIVISQGGVTNRIRKTTDGVTTNALSAPIYNFGTNSGLFFYAASGWSTALTVGQSYDFTATFSAEL